MGGHWEKLLSPGPDDRALVLAALLLISLPRARLVSDLRACLALVLGATTLS